MTKSFKEEALEIIAGGLGGYMLTESDYLSLIDLIGTAKSIEQLERIKESYMRLIHVHYRHQISADRQKLIHAILGMIDEKIASLSEEPPR